jgi:Surp module/CID domain
MIESVIPHPPVGDLDTVNRIRKLAEYVARNGPEFELKVKEKEAGNVAFSFLDRDLNPPGNRFYSWLLFCAKHFYTLDQVDAIETQHSLRIGQASVTGSLDLTEEDDAFFRSLLIKNTGSKECIKELRNWFISHSHSASAISFLFIEHMKNLNATCANSQDAGLFKSMLHTVYSINDIMFNSAGANSDGPYTW